VGAYLFLGVNSFVTEYAHKEKKIVTAIIESHQYFKGNSPKKIGIMLTRKRTHVGASENLSFMNMILSITN
jgi:hypothetical protein